jgi:RNA polymerase sigma factor (sigma-70 family)
MGSRRSVDWLGHLEALFQVGAIGGLTDAQLLEQFINSLDQGGELAFRAIVARHGPMVLRVCRSVLHDPHDAEDAFQVTFLALARKAGSIRKQASIASWLHGTAHRVALKARTAARRRQARESRVAAAAAGSKQMATPLEDTELSRIIHEEIERMPAKYRAPIVLCYLEGLTQEQAATELGWPAGTVRGRLARARDLLRLRLTRHGLALSAGLAVSGASADAAGLSAALLEATVAAALGRSTAGRLSRTVVLLLEAVLRDLAIARAVQLGAPLVLIAGIAGSAVLLFGPGGIGLFGDRIPILRIAPATRSALAEPAVDPLPDGALVRLGTTRFSPGTLIQDIVYSPDGTILASTDRQGDLNLWDAATGRLRRRIEPGKTDGRGGIRGVAFAPDGRSIAVSTNAATIVHDVASGRPIRRFEEQSQRHEGKAQASALAFSADGSILAVAFADAALDLWDIRTGRLIRSFDAESKGVSRLAVTPDGALLVSALSARDEPVSSRRKATGPDQSVLQVWDVATGKMSRRIGVGKATIGPMTLSRDGQTVTVGLGGRVVLGGKDRNPGSSAGSIGRWELATGRELQRIGGIDAFPRGSAFSPGGSMLVTGEVAVGVGPGTGMPRTTTLHLWDVDTGRELRRWEARAPRTGCLAFAPDGRTLAWVAYQEHMIRFWDTATGREVRPQVGHHGAIGDAAFTPDGRTLVTVSEDRTLRFWDGTTGRELRRFEAGDDRIWFAAMSADGRTLATGGGLQPARLWDVASGRELRRFSRPGESFNWCGDLSPDGQTLATSEMDRVILWDTASGERRAGKPKSRGQQGVIKALDFAPDGKSVATIGGDWVRFWDVATAAETRRFALPDERPVDGLSDSGARIVYAPDGATLAVASQRDGHIFVLDAADGREHARLDGPEGEFQALAFAPDGKFLATAVDTDDRTAGRKWALRLWDVAGRKELGRIPAHRSSIRALAFSSDGRRLVSASEDGTALVWDVAAIVARQKGAVEPRGSMVRKD